MYNYCLYQLVQNDYLYEKVYGEIDKLQTEGATNLKVVDLLKK